MIPHVVLGIAFLRFFTQIIWRRHLRRSCAVAYRDRVALRASPDACRRLSARPLRSNMLAVSLGGVGLTALKRITLPLVLPSGERLGASPSSIRSTKVTNDGVHCRPGKPKTLPVRMFLYIQDNIDPRPCRPASSPSPCWRWWRSIAPYGLRSACWSGGAAMADSGSDYDVAVVGGGPVGVATAWGSRARGCRVVVLDEGDRRCGRAAATLPGVGAEQRPRPGALCRLDDPSRPTPRGFAATLKEADRPRCPLQAGGFHPRCRSANSATRALQL